MVLNQQYYINSKLQFTKGILPCYIISISKMISRTCLQIQFYLNLLTNKVQQPSRMRILLVFHTHARAGPWGSMDSTFKGYTYDPQHKCGASCLPHTNLTAAAAGYFIIYTTRKHRKVLNWEYIHPAVLVNWSSVC